MESMANWADLPPEISAEIAVKLKEIGDFTAFRGVCSSWRAAAAKDIVKGAKLPLLMLYDYREHQKCKFYSLSTRKIRKALFPPEAKGMICTYAKFGWIIAVASSGDEVYLFKPFSSSPTIRLPDFHSCLRHEWAGYVMDATKAMLTANPSETSDFKVFVVRNRFLGFWKNGDKNWTRIEAQDAPGGGFTNIGCCSTKMYAIDSEFGLWSWDPSTTHATQLLTLDFLYAGMKPYVVESTAGELLVITSTHYYNLQMRFRWTDLRVMRIDVEKRDWYEMHGGVGKDAIFCSGQGDAVSVAADDFPGVIKPNSVYFSVDGEGTIIFNFANKSIRRFCNKPFHFDWLFP